jgi:hypothetical protein
MNILKLCAYCESPQVCVTNGDRIPVCNHHLKNPPSTIEDRLTALEQRLAPEAEE